MARKGRKKEKERKRERKKGGRSHILQMAEITRNENVIFVVNKSACFHVEDRIKKGKEEKLDLNLNIL